MDNSGSGMQNNIEYSGLNSLDLLAGRLFRCPNRAGGWREWRSLNPWPLDKMPQATASNFFLDHGLLKLPGSFILPQERDEEKGEEEVAIIGVCCTLAARRSPPRAFDIIERFEMTRALTPASASVRQDSDSLARWHEGRALRHTCRLRGTSPAPEGGTRDFTQRERTILDFEDPHWSLRLRICCISTQN